MEDNTKQFELSYYYHEISIIHQKNNKNRKICDNIIEIPFPLFQGWLRNAVFLYKYSNSMRSKMVMCEFGGVSMIRQTGLAQAIDIAGNRAKYDECAKKLLSYKAIIAWILKSCIKEFSQYEVQYICDNCLKEEVEVSTHAVHQDELDKDKRLGGDERVEGMNTESNSIQEHTIYYDIRLPAFLPESNERVRLILNLEIQLDDTPGYPIVKRGFYYCERMISE